MQVESVKEEVFALQLRSARFEEMTNMLRCKLCSGLLRFAHTLTECGHTFCQHCIFSYINAFKGRNPEVKCPQCRAPVQPVFHRSVIRDVFKQSLVDLLDPSFAIREKVIIDRIRRLFPQFNLAFLLDQFSFSTFDSMKKKRADKSKVMSGLANAVKEKLGISFQSFSEMIADEESFQKLLEKKLPEVQDVSLILDVRPRNQEDYRFVAVNHKMKAISKTVGKMRKYLEKRVLLRLQNHEELAREMIEPDCIQLSVRVDLYFEDRLLEDNQQLSTIPQIDQIPIYYHLSR